MPRLLHRVALAVLLAGCVPPRGPNAPAPPGEGIATEAEREAAARIAEGSPVVALTDRTVVWITADAAGRPGLVIEQVERYLVLDARAADVLTPTASYDDDLQLHDFDVRTYAPDGTSFAADPREVWDVRHFPANILYTDARRRIALPARLSPGVVVRVRTLLRQAHARFMPHLFLVGDFPTVRREVHVSAAPGTALSAVQLPEGTALTPDPDGALRVVRTDVPAARAEPGAPPPLRHLPAVALAVRRAPVPPGETFFDTWESLARYYERLVRPNLQPDDRVRALAASIAQTADTDRDARIAAAARWVRTHLRYVAIEAGIHAVQPRPVPDVLRRGYGDCKELSALLVAILRLLEVPAHPFLVPAGGSAVLPRDVPAMQWFNHVIVAVEADGGYRFIDPTLPAGDTWSLAEPVQGVEGLVASTRPAIVRTPVDAADANRRVTSIDVALASDGSAVMDVTSTLHGLLAMELREQRRFGRPGAGRNFLHAALHSRYGASDTDVVEETGFDRNDGATRLRFKLATPRFAIPTGTRWLLYPEFLAGGTSGRGGDWGGDTRAAPFDFGASAVDQVEAVITLPTGATVEMLPDPMRVETSFGTVEARFESPRPGEVRYTRRIVTHGRVVPASQVEAVERFQDALEAASAAPVVVRAVPTATPPAAPATPPAGPAAGGAP